MASVVRERKVTNSDRAVVDSLARDLELPVDDVEKVYVTEMARLESGARIRTFLTVLTIGSVRNRLHRPGGGGS